MDVEKHLDRVANKLAELQREIDGLGSPLTVVEFSSHNSGRTPSQTTITRRQKLMRVIQ